MALSLKWDRERYFSATGWEELKDKKEFLEHLCFKQGFKRCMERKGL